MQIDWQKRYEIGNVEIDAEHKVFIKIIGKIKVALSKKNEWTQLVFLLEELLKYADFHFCSEENVMRSVNFPDLISHQKEHQQLLTDLRQKIHFLQAKKTEKSDELISFLMHWFLNHTLNEDRQIVHYIKNQ